MGWLPRVGQDEGSKWQLGPGEKAAAAAAGYSKYDAQTLALKCDGLLGQLADLSVQTAGESEEVETLKAKVALLQGQAHVFVTTGSGGATQYKSLLSQFNAYSATYADILSRAVPVEEAPPEAVKPTAAKPVVGPVTQPGVEKSTVVLPKKEENTWWPYAVAAGLIGTGVVLLKVARVF